MSEKVLKKQNTEIFIEDKALTKDTKTKLIRVSRKNGGYFYIVAIEKKFYLKSDADNYFNLLTNK